MVRKKTSGHGCFVTTLGILVACAMVAGVFSRFGGFGTGPTADAGEFGRYVTEVAGIEIPAGTRIVALGEATHASPKDPPCVPYIDGPIMMGCVGEYFSLLMYVLPQSYRGKRKPSRPYDGIIFVPYAHPTELLPWP